MIGGPLTYRKYRSWALGGTVKASSSGHDRVACPGLSVCNPIKKQDERLETRHMASSRDGCLCADRFARQRSGLGAENDRESPRTDKDVKSDSNKIKIEIPYPSPRVDE